MPRQAGDPLRKVTLNLYEADCAWMEQRLGHGWSEQVRELVHNYVKMNEQPSIYPSCDHRHYKFDVHGRRCTCGELMVDFGD